MFKNVKIGTKAAFIFAIVLAVSLLTVSYVLLYASKKALTEVRLTAMEAIADMKSSRIEDLIARLKSEIQIAQDYFNIRLNLPVLQEYDSNRSHPAFLEAKERLDGQLKRFQAAFPLVKNILLVGTQGKVVYVSREASEKTYLGKTLQDTDGRAFEEGKKGIYFTEMFRSSEAQNEPRMLLTASVLDLQGKFAGIIAFDVNLGPIYRLLQERTGLGESGETFIAKRRGEGLIFLNSPQNEPDAALNKKIVMGAKEALPIQQAVLGKRGSGKAMDYRGREVLAAWRHLPSMDWGMVAKMDAEEAFAPISLFERNVFLLALGILGIALTFAFFISGQIVQSNEALLEGEKKLRRVVESVPNGILMVSQEGKIVLANAQAERLFGYSREELLGQTIEMLVPESSRAGHPEYRRAFFSEPQSRFMGSERNLKGRRKDGTEFPVEMGLSPVQTGEGLLALASVSDISLRKDFERKMFAVERLAAMGKMSSHIAHEVRNPLSSIGLNLDLLSDELEALPDQGEKDSRPRQEIKSLLKAIQKEVDRLAALAGEYLKFSKPPEQKKEKVYLNEFLSGMVHFLNEEAKRHQVELVFSKTHNAPFIFMDPGQMEQVFLNLIRNAFDAMPQGGKVEIGILQDESAATVFVKDEGAGMDEETQTKVFDPFFTTKGHGTGLGLVVAHQVVVEHGGAVWCESEKGKGTTFFVRYPNRAGQNPPVDLTTSPDRGL